jgi:integrator complex subunit 4
MIFITVNDVIKLRNASVPNDHYGSFYNNLFSLLNHDDPLIRLEALETLHLRTRMEIKEKTFIKICSMIEDSSPLVRRKVCELIGLYAQDVSTVLLMQLLSKQPLNKSNTHASNGQSLKKKPRLVLPGGLSSCGAILLALEDEFEEIRNSALDSIRKLSINKEFAVEAINFIVDMFHDEVSNVRVNAIFTLSVFNEKLIFTPSQLESLLMLLKEDSDNEVRKFTYKTLGNSIVDQKNLLKSIILNLQDNLKRFPCDSKMIYCSLENLIKSNISLLAGSVGQLIIDLQLLSSSQLSSPERIF